MLTEPSATEQNQTKCTSGDGFKKNEDTPHDQPRDENQKRRLTFKV